MLTVFKKFGTVLFESIAFGALLEMALLCLLKPGPEKLKISWKLLLAAVFYMLGWRLLIGIGSSRYAAALLFPGIILTAAFCWDFRDYLASRFPSFPAGLARILPWLLLAGIAISCTVKTLKINRYDKYIAECSRKAASDRPGDPARILVSYRDNMNRFSYYTGISETLCLNDYDNFEIFDDPKLLKQLETLRFISGTLYVMVPRPSGQPFLQAKDFGEKEENWKLLTWQYTNNRKTRRLEVYRYTPHPAEEGLVEKISPERAASWWDGIRKNTVRNGDFEKAGKTVSGPFASEIRPTDWAADYRNPNDASAFLGLSSDSPILGRFSLRAAGNDMMHFYLNEAFPRSSYRMEFLARGKKGTQIRIQAFYTAEGVFSREKIACLILDGSELKKFCIPVHIQMPKNGFFQLGFSVSEGEVLLEAVSMTPEKKQD